MPESAEPTGKQDPKPVAQVMDPSMSAEARNRLVRKIKRSDSEAADDAAGCGFFLAVIGAITLPVLHFAIGLSWWWMLAGALPIAIGTALMAALGSKLNNQDHGQFVRAAHLDELSREHMFRAQKAIRSILKSRVYAGNSFDQAVNAPTLRQQEWEIAIALRKISELRAELKASTGDSEPGPMTTKVLESQQHALMLATNATISRIGELERYAKEIEMADAAERDWRAAVKASGHNGQYLDLIARTAADEHAIAEIQGWTEQASAAAKVFREHLYQASLAAGALVLPAIPRIDDRA